MARTVIKTSKDGASLFSALAIGLGMEILSGKLDISKDAPGYKHLLETFAQYHKNFNPKTWENLKLWLAFYNNSKDMELILAPVLFQLNQHYQEDLDSQISKELTQLVLMNKDKIKSGNAWYELTVLNAKNITFLPKLDSLELSLRKELLTTLKNALLLYLDQFLSKLSPGFLDLQKSEQDKVRDNFKAEVEQHLIGLTGEEISKIFATDFSSLVTSIKPKILANNNYQRAYTIEDLSGMTDALSLNFVESNLYFDFELNLESGLDLSPLAITSTDKTTIHLQSSNNNWDVLIEEADIDLINRSPRKLKKSVVQAFREKVDIPAPAIEQVRSVGTPGAIIKKKIIDNPGGGDCAFYAFAIAIINIIKEESFYNNKNIFNQWVALDPSLRDQFAPISSFDFDRPNNELLKELQRSLRTISYHTQLNELKRACVNPENDYTGLVGNSIYVKFAEFYYHPRTTDARFNEFAASDQMLAAVLNIDRSTVRENAEHLVLVPKFLSLIYGEDVDPKSITTETLPSNKSPVIQALGCILEDAFWGTHLNLDYLARAFMVNFHPLENLVARQTFVDIDGRHTVTINNVHNAHWTTQVTYAQELRPLTAIDMVISESATVLASSAEALGISLPISEKMEKVNEQPAKEKISSPSKNIFTQILKSDKSHPTKENKNSQLRDSQTKTVSFDLTPQQLEIETEKEKRLLEENSRLLGLGDSEEAKKSVAPAELKQQRQLEYLSRVVTRTVVSYINYSESIWFSIFHRHGSSGIVRARNFLTEFLMIDDPNEAKTTLVNFLLNNKNNGNTYPHSFRTMLLNELQRDPKPTLQYTSEHFDEMVDELSSILQVDKDKKNFQF